MSLNLGIDASVDPDQRLVLLLAQQAELQARNEHLQAEIASLLPSNAPSSSYRNQHSSVQKHHHRRSNVPRSISSSAAPTISRHLSSDRNQAVAISKSLSQRSAPSMARTNSRGSASRRSGKVPFTSNASARQIAPPTDTRRESPAMAAWTTTYEQPLSSYTFSHQQPQLLQRSSSQRKSELDRVPEHSRVLEDPSNYIARAFGKEITPLPSNSPLSPSGPSMHAFSHGSDSFHVPTPSTLSTEALTSATTLTNNSMSRADSLFNEGLPESMQMLRFNSNASYSNISHVDQPYDHVPPTFSSRPIRRSSNEEQSQLLVGTGGASNVSQFSHSLPVHLASSASHGEKMEKSASNSSNSSSSSSSSSSRSKQVLRVQNQQAASRPLMPKGGCEDGLMLRNNSSSTCRLDSKDGSQDKVAITKPAYQRPKHDRVYCKKCDIHPAGFRGEHELRRHQDRDHKRVVKKWVCVDPTGDGQHHLVPIMPLSKCKACSQQKKYGAYYNAAAHLRRTHFRAKSSKGRGKGSKELEEKLGGKAAGDWPLMTDLKYWMKEVEEEVPDYGLSESQQEEADASDNDIDTVLEEELTTHEKMSITSSQCFDTDFFGDAPPVFDTYQPIITDMYALQFPLDSHGQCMDETMYTDSSQNFSDYSPNLLMNDHLAFTDVNFSQSFDDQALMAGPDSKYFSY